MAILTTFQTLSLKILLDMYLSHHLPSSEVRWKPHPASNRVWFLLVVFPICIEDKRHYAHRCPSGCVK
ncbi:MAG: hypothetical protein WBJ17_09355, partial [Natronincolaceae bacterium]